MKTGIELIAAERQEQMEKHKRIIARDIKENGNFQLSVAAAILCIVDLDPEDYEELCPFGWDIDIFTHMCSKPYEERLIIAGALIAAEIDRINFSMVNESILNQIADGD